MIDLFESDEDKINKGDKFFFFGKIYPKNQT